MSDFAVTLKNALTQSAKFVGRTACSTAKAAKFKVSELTTLGKRRELINELGEMMFDLAKGGFNLPVEASVLLEQLKSIENDLETLRAAHAAEKAADAEKTAAEKGIQSGERTASTTACTFDKDMDLVDEPIAKAETDSSVEFEAKGPVMEVTEETSSTSDKTDREIPTLDI